jgi:hypothetical protein
LWTQTTKPSATMTAITESCLCRPISGGHAVHKTASGHYEGIVLISRGFATWMCKPRAATLYYAACGHICKLRVHSFCCVTEGPRPLSKRVLHTVRASASSFILQHPLFSLTSFSSCLRLLSHVPVTSVLPSVFP